MQSDKSVRLEESRLARRFAAVRSGFLFIWLALLMGCAPKSPFEPLRLVGPPEKYRSATWTRQSTVHVTAIPAGLRCVVEADSDPKAMPYGGLMFSGCDAKRWRLELAFTEPEAIMAAYVDGYNRERQRVVRWQTGWGGKLRRERSAYIFTPQQSAEGFKFIASEGTGPVEVLQVFVRVKPGSRSSFELYEVGLAKKD